MTLCLHWGFGNPERAWASVIVVQISSDDGLLHQPVSDLPYPLRQLIPRHDTKVIVVKNDQPKNVDVLIAVNIWVDVAGWSRQRHEVESLGLKRH